MLVALALPAGAEPELDATAETEFLTGQLIVASPKMGDPRFTETVILMIKHDADGAMGLVVNRVIGAGPLGELLAGFGIDGAGAEGDISIHYGGPVQPNLGFVLHSTDYSDAATVEVNDHVALTTELNVLEAISHGNGPTHSLFALGYAGWAAGQLEGELRKDAWYVAPADKTIIFDDAMETKWKRAVALRAIDL
jgi:putative transcriptional regulator